MRKFICLKANDWNTDSVVESIGKVYAEFRVVEKRREAVFLIDHQDTEPPC